LFFFNPDDRRVILIDLEKVHAFLPRSLFPANVA